jgi:putative aldouronate transport system permease protein
MKIRQSRGQAAFDAANALFMFFVMLVTLYPMLYVLFASLSNPQALMRHQGLIWFPLGINFASYKAVFANPMIRSGYLNTVVVVVFGVALNMAMTSLGAYFLSRKNIALQKTTMFMIVFTMFFSGGLIPFYILVKGLRMDNSLMSLIVPGAINTFNLIIMRTAFAAVPSALEESAKIDGAGHFTILFKIIVPLSLPTMAVMVLYYGVAHWNAWFNAMIFLNRRRNLYPLQLALQEILIANDTNSMSLGSGAGDTEMLSETIKYAVIIVATLPILSLYPFLQKYFVKGIMVGAVKG